MNHDSDCCPVPAEFIGRLYRAPKHRISEIVSDLSRSERGGLATFCYGRAHLRAIGLAIAADLRLGNSKCQRWQGWHFLFELSREPPSDERPVSYSRQPKVSLAGGDRTQRTTELSEKLGGPRKPEISSDGRW